MSLRPCDRIHWRPARTFVRSLLHVPVQIRANRERVMRSPRRPAEAVDLLERATAPRKDSAACSIARIGPSQPNTSREADLCDKSPKPSASRGAFLGISYCCRRC